MDRYKRNIKTGFDHCGVRYGLDSAGKGKKSMRNPVRKIRMEYEG
jgi:hypothetical protein